MKKKLLAVIALGLLIGGSIVVGLITLEKLDDLNDRPRYPYA